jgi:hypothetical protein
LIIKKGDHEPIIQEDVWELANEKLLREYHPKYAKPDMVMSHWLSSVLYCSNCNGTLVSGGSSGGFQCNKYAKGTCNESHYVSFGKIETAVLDSLNDLIISNNFEFEIINIETTNNNEILKSNLKKLGLKEKRIKDAYINGIDSLDEYKTNKERLEAERIDLENRMSAAKSIRKTKAIKNIMLDRLKSVYTVLISDADKKEKNAAIKTVVKKIVYDKKNENIDIYIYFS